VRLLSTPLILGGERNAGTANSFDLAAEQTNLTDSAKSTAPAPSGTSGTGGTTRIRICPALMFDFPRSCSGPQETGPQRSAS
jgi:hypothetical protein